MKILYAIQGTGNGHIARAKELLPAFAKRAEVDVLISGMHAELSPGFPVRYRLKGLGFKFGKKGGVDYFNTWWQGDVSRFIREISALDLSGYDLVVNDFEPVSAWAARRQHVPCVGLSNQCILNDARIPKPDTRRSRTVAKAILKHYAPVDTAYGFHYFAAEPFITTPVIRKVIREATAVQQDHYVVYLPFYNDEKILRNLTQFTSARWVVFSKHSRMAYTKDNVEVFPVNEALFMEKLLSCRGVMCAAGFGTTTEALYLGKKLIAVPMKNQFEQACNALALAQLGIPVVQSIKKKWHSAIQHWLDTNATLQVDYPDNAQAVADRIIGDFARQSALLSDAMSIGLEGGSRTR